MFIGGLEKLSLIDYPGCLSAVVFTKGCNFRCDFCYNPMLVSMLVVPQIPGEERGYPFLREDSLFQFFKKRVGKLDAIVITGGEPTMHSDLPEFIKKIKKLGFLIKLDTNGSNPEMLEKIIKEKLVDYIAMDLKADEKNYSKTSGVKISFSKIEKSVKIIMSSGLPYEFRTTCVPGFLDKEIIENMGKTIKGADKWYLQNFKSDTKLLNKELVGRKPFSSRAMEEFSNIGRKYAKICEVRGQIIN